jgi:hypothetical protein
VVIRDVDGRVQQALTLTKAYGSKEKQDERGDEETETSN